MASRERIQNQFEQYQRALSTLQEALELKANINNNDEKLQKALRDACIQRFNRTYATSSKTS